MAGCGGRYGVVCSVVWLDVMCDVVWLTVMCGLMWMLAMCGVVWHSMVGCNMWVDVTVFVMCCVVCLNVMCGLAGVYVEGMARCGVLWRIVGLGLV